MKQKKTRSCCQENRATTRRFRRNDMQKGTLQLDRPLELPDGTKVQLTIIPSAEKSILNATDRKIVGEVVVEDDEVFQALAK